MSYLSLGTVPERVKVGCERSGVEKKIAEGGGEHVAVSRKFSDPKLGQASNTERFMKQCSMTTRFVKWLRPKKPPNRSRPYEFSLVQNMLGS